MVVNPKNYFTQWPIPLVVCWTGKMRQKRSLAAPQPSHPSLTINLKGYTNPFSLEIVFSYHIAVSSLYGEYVGRFFLPDGVFLPCCHGLNFLHQLCIGENSTDQSTSKSLQLCHPAWSDGVINICFKKILNTLRPSEHSPVRGKDVGTFRWDHRLQRQNLFVAFNRVSQ